MTDLNKRIEEIYNKLKLDYYEMSEANGEMTARVQRQYADVGVKNIARAEKAIKALISEILDELEMEKKCKHYFPAFEGVCERCGENRSNAHIDLGYNEAISELHTKLAALREKLK